MFSSPVVGHLTYSDSYEYSQTSTPFLPKLKTTAKQRLAFATTLSGMSPSSQQTQQQQQQRLNEMIVSIQAEKNQNLMARNTMMMTTMTTSRSAPTALVHDSLNHRSSYCHAEDRNGHGQESGRVSTASSFQSQPQPRADKSSQLEDQPSRYMSTTTGSFLHSYSQPESRCGQITGGSTTTTTTSNNSNNNRNHKKKRTSLDVDPVGVSIGDYHKRNKTIVDKKRNGDSENKASSATATIAASSADYALLHNACKLFAQNTAVVASALQFDPESAHLAVPVVCLRLDDTPDTTTTTTTTTGSSIRGGSPVAAQPYETYKYAINVALKHNASLGVLKLLAEAAPEVLLKPDGPDQACTIEILLAMISQPQRQKTEHEEPSRKAKELDRIVKVLLHANPLAASGTDRHQNMALHYVARYGGGGLISARTVKTIYRSFPMAAQHSNFHGHTPLDVAVRNTFVSEAVLDTLQSLSFKDCEGDAVINMDLIEEGLDHSSTGSQISYESFNRDTFSF